MQTIPVLVSQSFRSLALNKARTLLSGLGIAIGVCSLGLMLAISAAAQQTVSDKLSALGTNQFLIRSKGTSAPGRHPLVLTQRDASELDRDPRLQGAAPALQCSCLVAVGSSWVEQVVLGTTPTMFRLRNWKVAKGRELFWSDVEDGRASAVLGPGIAERLFPDGKPIGRVLRINGLPFLVIGVTTGSGLNLDGVEPANQIVVPFGVVPRADGVSRESVSYVSVQGTGAATADDITSLVTHRLSTIRGHAVLADELTSVDLATVGEAAKGVSKALGGAFLFVSLIALFVGGVGIMNVMLASAAERTRDIGIRLAIGAAPLEIFLQFLIESVLLCVVAAAVGALLAAWLAAAITAAGTLSVTVSAQDMALSVGVAAAIGIVFGVFPARRAASVLPNEALRAA